MPRQLAQFFWRYGQRHEPRLHYEAQRPTIIGSDRACIRSTQLRTATTPGTTMAVHVQSPQTA